ncbi:enhanced intracellular survival protein Eis [uncultured Paenibacillus sp.]|uniref:GNAT family N-acetyltransferase n=1 Tax=uncultured Paenibacillus sp. TaxID=227322 RepID=UPI0015B35CE1|nr:GNAT family N-acetyltransferase [uncultured Paenibacillus sp.]
MEIRPLQADEFDASLSLSEYAFQYKVDPEEREEQRKSFIPERSWGAFEDGELFAKLMLLPLHLYVQGRSIPMGGIAGVATWPEHRRSGLVKELLTAALRRMNEQGQHLSCLHPFSIPFYRRFGWEVYTDYKKYTIPIDSFPSKTYATGSVKRDVKDIKLLDGIYHAFARRYNGMLVRDEEWWKRSVLGDQGHTAVYYTESGQPEGYLLYQVKNGELVVGEFVYLNETARQGLWAYLANHDSMVARVVIDRVPADDLLPYLLRDPRCKQETVPYFMARIVNAAAFIGDYSFTAPASAGRIRLDLRIEDGFAPWNGGDWRLEVSPEGRGSLTQADPVNPGLVCDIQTLTAMLLGYKRPREMFACGKLSGPEADAETLERLIPFSQTALLDFF